MSDTTAMPLKAVSFHSLQHLIPQCWALSPLYTVTCSKSHCDEQWMKLESRPPNSRSVPATIILSLETVQTVSASSMS